MKIDFLQITVSPLHIVMLQHKSRRSSTNIFRVGMGEQPIPEEDIYFHSKLYVKEFKRTMFARITHGKILMQQGFDF